MILDALAAVLGIAFAAIIWTAWFLTSSPAGGDLPRSPSSPVTSPALAAIRAGRGLFRRLKAAGIGGGKAGMIWEETPGGGTGDSRPIWPTGGK